MPFPHHDAASTGMGRVREEVALPPGVQTGECTLLPTCRSSVRRAQLTTSVFVADAQSQKGVRTAPPPLRVSLIRHHPYIVSTLVRRQTWDRKRTQPPSARVSGWALSEVHSPDCPQIDASSMIC